MKTTDRPAAPTVPCPADQQQPVAPTRSSLAAIALAADIAADDVRSYLTGQYRCISIVRLFRAVQP